MKHLKKYETQIFNGITIFLIVTFVIFPGLTEANTFLNIMSGIGLLLLLVWGGLALYQYVTSDKQEPSESEQKWKEHVEMQMEKMKEMHEQNEALKKKSNPKQFDGVESDKPFVKTRKKTNKTK